MKNKTSKYHSEKIISIFLIIMSISLILVSFTALLVELSSDRLDSSDLVAITMILPMTILGFIFVRNLSDKKDGKFLLQLFIVGFSIRFLFTFVLFFILKALNQPLFAAEYEGFSDDLSYHMIASEIVDSWRRGNLFPDLLFRTNPGYPFLCSFLYFIFGLNTLLVRLVNCFFSALIPVLCYLVSKRLYDAQIAKISAFLALLFPTFITFPFLQYRDIILATLIMLFVWRMVTLQTESKLIDILQACFLLIIIFAFRSYAAFMLAIVMGLALFFAAHTIEFKIAILVTLIIFTLFIGIFYEAGGSPLMNEETFFDILNMKMGAGQNLLRHNTLPFYKLNNRFALSLANILLVLTRPFPGKKLDLGTLMAPGMIAWYFIIPAVIFGIFYSIRYKTKNTLILYSFVLLTLAAIGILLVGNSYRYRMQIMPINFIFASVGFRYFQKWRFLYFCYLIFFGFLFIGYLSYKLWGI